jgi:hypothetical protein
MDITYKFNIIPEANEIIDLYQSSGMPRPVNDIAHISKI